MREPWRRYFARALDVSLGGLVVTALLELVFHVNTRALTTGLPSWSIMVNALIGAMSWVVWAPVGALLLSRFRTTPGKWLLGLYVEHVDGRRLTYGEALWREMSVFVYGNGGCIPLISVICNWRSYRAVNDKGASCDEECTILFHERRREVVKYLGAWAAVLVADLLVILVAGMPIHRGALTAEEFAENYNQLARYYDMPTAALQRDGTLLIDAGSALDGGGPFLLEIETTDGVVTGVSYARAFSSAFPGRYANQDGASAILLSAMALAWADSNIISVHLPNHTEVLERFETFSEGSLEWSLLGWRLTYDIHSDPSSADVPVFDGLTQREYEISFEMHRIDG